MKHMILLISLLFSFSLCFAQQDAKFNKIQVRDIVSSGNNNISIEPGGTGVVEFLDNKGLLLQDDDSSAGVTIDVPATLSASYSLTLPVDDGDANEVLTTNGSGVLSWSAGGGGGSSAQNVLFYADSGNGHGSTNTRIRRYSNVRSNSLGVYGTYADSATLGGSVTIDTAGVYEVSCGDRRLSGTDAIGISVNTSGPTTGITGLAESAGRRASQDISSDIQMVTRVLYLAVNDVVRCHSNGNVDDTGSNSFFAVTLIID